MSKKTAAAKKTTTKKTETALVKWEDKLAQYAKKASAAEKSTVGGMPRVSLRGGQMTVDDMPVQGNELRVVVLSAVHTNGYYTEKYDPNVVSLPICYSHGDPEAENPEAEMVPHEESEDPQHEDCASCPHNQFGSADTGRGKACKNVRNLAIITEDELEDLATAEIRRLQIPPTSLKTWGAYVRSVVADLNLPPFAVVTNIKVVPDAKAQFKLHFSTVGKIEFDQDLFEQMERRRKEANESLTAPFPKPEDLPEPEPVKKRATRRTSKATAARKTTRAARKF